MTLSDGDSGTLVVVVRGELDLATSGQLVEIAAKRIADQPPERVVLELSAVTFLSAAGLRALVRVHEVAAAHGAVLRLVATAPAVQRPLRITGLLAAHIVIEGG